MKREIINNLVRGIAVRIKTAKRGVKLEARQYRTIEGPTRYMCNVYRRGEKVYTHYFFSADELADGIEWRYQVKGIDAVLNG